MKHLQTQHKRQIGLIGLVLVLAVFLLAACGNDDGASAPRQESEVQAAEAQSSGGAQQPEETAEAAKPEEEGIVEIGMYTSGGAHYNDPLGIHVEPGTTVRFINRSGAHTVTAYHPEYRRELRIPENAEPFDSGVLSGRNATFEVTLEVEGVYDYVCTLHEAQGHVGRIVVGDPNAAPAKPADGLPGRAPDYLISVEEIMAQHHIAYERR